MIGIKPHNRARTSLFFLRAVAVSPVMSRTPKTASTVPTSADVNDTSLLDDDSLLTSETGVPEVDLLSEDSLARLQGKLGIDSMSSKIDYLSEIVEQALTADSAQPCKRKRAQFDPSEQIDAASDAGDILQEIELPPSVFDVSEAQGPRVFDALRPDQTRTRVDES